MLRRNISQNVARLPFAQQCARSLRPQTVVTTTCLFHTSRVRLAPKKQQPTTTTPPTASSALPKELPATPYDYDIGRALLPGESATLPQLVRTLIDLEAEGVEEVSLEDFVAMVPKRQLQALGGQKQWQDMILGSEPYQATKDLRELRRAGIQTVGQWEERRDRVPIALYSRGLLQKAYHDTTRNTHQRQRDEVLDWLTNTIREAVADEMASAKKKPLWMPLLVEQPAAPVLPEGETTPEKITPDDVKKVMDDLKEEAELAAVAEKIVQEETKDTKKEEPAAKEAEEEEQEEEKEVEKQVDEEEDEIAKLLAEAEEEYTPTPYVRGGKTSAADAKAAKKAAEEKVPEPEAEAEEEEEEKPKEEEVEAPATPARNKKQQKDFDRLQKLSELFMTQMNSADGFIHCEATELESEEKAGDVIRIDEDTALLDPVALFSSYHKADITAEDPLEMQALKTVWNQYNKQQVLLENATNEKEEAFYRQRSVDAIVHGAVLLRAVSREEPVALDLVAAGLPPYGFPLLSCDTRPFNAADKPGVVRTDMTFTKVAQAAKEFKAFFAQKQLRHVPFTPLIDVNRGCGVVQIEGNVLHLYETSLKKEVHEANVRLPFAEALLGVYYLFRNKILSRVNTVVYHILVTTVPADVDAQEEMMSPTSIVSIDLYGAFTKAERNVLHTLAEPLDLTHDVSTFDCLDDFIVAMEESFKVQVQHELTQSRQDLDGFMTPTLLQLLPEADEIEDAEEEEEVVPAKKGGKPSKAAKQPEPEEEEEEDIEAQLVEEEEEEIITPPKKNAKPTKKAKQPEPEPEEEEEALAEEEDDEEEVVAPPKKHTKPARKTREPEPEEEEEEDFEALLAEEEDEEVIPVKKGGKPARKTREPEPEEEDEEVVVAPKKHTKPARKVREPEPEEEEEDIEAILAEAEEEEEEVVPVKKNAKPSKAAKQPEPEEEEEDMEALLAEEEDEEDVAPPKKNVKPVKKIRQPEPEPEEEEEEEEEVVPTPVKKKAPAREDSEQAWFRKKPKRKFFN